MTRDVIAEFKALRLHGMAGTWADLLEQNKDELPDRHFKFPRLSTPKFLRAGRGLHY